MKAIMLILLAISAFPGVSRAQAPYVQPIQPEADTIEALVMRIEGATASDFFAPGYEEAKILGKRFRISGFVTDVSRHAYRDIVITFSARDIFGNVLATSREELPAIEPEGEAPFQSTLDVPVASEFHRITYSISGSISGMRSD